MGTSSTSAMEEKGRQKRTEDGGEGEALATYLPLSLLPPYPLPPACLLRYTTTNLISLSVVMNVLLYEQGGVYLFVRGLAAEGTATISMGEGGGERKPHTRYI